MLVGRARPHNVGLLRIRLCVSWVSLHHRLGLTAYDHDMSACLDPVVIRHGLGRVWIGVARSVISAKHVDEPELLWSRPLVLPSLSPLHGRLVCAHGCPARVHTRPPVVTLLYNLHLAV